MFRSRKLRACDLDAKAYEELAACHPAVAVAALDRFAARDLGSVRNLSAFLLAQLRTVRHLVINPPPMCPFPPLFALHTVTTPGSGYVRCLLIINCGNSQGWDAFTSFLRCVRE
jgi:hypothetical protein